MISIALIGGDGSGKSTISTMLIEDFPLPVKRVYMGANIESSNYTLPWTKLILKLKLFLIRRQAKKKGIEDETYLTTHHIEHRQVKTGPVRVLLRSTYRFAEYVYRLGVAWWFKRHGYNVIFDRHFLFDTIVDPENPDRSAGTAMKRANHWLLATVLPRPDLFLYLDATPEIMLTRKHEVTVEYLQKQRQIWLNLGKKFDNFVCVDANRPIEQVYADVSAIIHDHCKRKETGRTTQISNSTAS
jgi:thymidylate kinase